MVVVVKMEGVREIEGRIIGLIGFVDGLGGGGGYKRGEFWMIWRLLV